MDLTKIFRDPKIAHSLLQKLQACDISATLMEVCGTHTVELFKTGIHRALPKQVRLVSGPGCPVCVTDLAVIDTAIMLAKKAGHVLFCFGDMMRVPGTLGSLQDAKAQGADVRIMYSPVEALDYARQHPQDQVIVFGVGFETTIPLFAAMVLSAKSQGLGNIFLLCAFKVVPPALCALLDAQDCRIDGFILPGHVSLVIGAQAYKFLEEKYHVPAVITGFDSVDLLEGLLMLLEMVAKGESLVKNQYRRFVSASGNKKAQTMIKEVFVASDTAWRGLGIIPKSGLQLKPRYQDIDAVQLIDFKLPKAQEPKGCLCGQVISGNKRPSECPLFRKRCSPQQPVGACMVSSEGTCAAYYKYSGYS